MACTEPPHEATHWTGRAMAKAMGISLSSVQRIWQAHRLQPHRLALNGAATHHPRSPQEDPPWNFDPQIQRTRPMHNEALRASHRPGALILRALNGIRRSEAETSPGMGSKNCWKIKDEPSSVSLRRAWRCIEKRRDTVRLCYGGGVPIRSHRITIQLPHQCNRCHETRTNQPTAWSQ